MSRLIISKLPPSPAASGFLCRFMAEFEPFTHFEFGAMTRTLNYQLETGNHLVGGLDDAVVGYIGWIRTSIAIADAWVAAGGALTPEKEGEAIAITVLGVQKGGFILPLVREAKRLNPHFSVYWKRHLESRGRYEPRFVRKSPL